MALKALITKRNLDLKRKQLEGLRAKDADFEKREQELETAINEAESEEDQNAVEDEVSKFDAEKADHEAEKSKLTGEIEQLEADLKETEESAPTVTEDNKKRSDNKLSRDYFAGMTQEDRVYLGRADVRARYAESLKIEEVRTFYENVRDAVMSKRALTETDLTIPDDVYNRVQILVGDYGVLYSEVDVVSLNGTARIVLDGANPEAIWVEMCDPVQELASSFTAVEIDGYKVGGFIPVCNAIIEDSMISLAMYVERKLAIAIAKSLDKAILSGTGATGKQPMGIIPNLATANSVTLADNVTGGIFGSMFSNLALIDTGENDVGEIVAVMKRSTYYNSIAPRLVIANSGGTYTLPNINAPSFAGLRTVFSQYMPDGQALVGDFKKYVLGERAGVKLATSIDVRFIEDQTVFKGTARYDGKPVNLDTSGKTADWILATIPAPVPTP